MTPRTLIALGRRPGPNALGDEPDERLVDLTRAGSEAAFETIVARHRQPLIRYATRFLPEPRAEEVVQESFVRAYAALTRGEKVRCLGAWLYRIVHNVAINGLRDRSLGDEPLDERYLGAEHPEIVVERREGLRDVLSAVGSLPGRQRDAIVLRELEGRSYEEIAGQLGVTNGAVRALLNRARVAIRAAVTALIPPWQLLRLPRLGGDAAGSNRAAELSAGSAAGTVAAKACVTALVAGAAAVGVASTDLGSKQEAAKREGSEVTGALGTAAAGAGDLATGSSGTPGSLGASGGQKRALASEVKPQPAVVSAAGVTGLETASTEGAAHGGGEPAGLDGGPSERSDPGWDGEPRAGRSGHHGDREPASHDSGRDAPGGTDDGRDGARSGAGGDGHGGRHDGSPGGRGGPGPRSGP